MVIEATLVWKRQLSQLQSNKNIGVGPQVCVFTSKKALITETK